MNREGAMAQVEIYDGEGDQLLFTGGFDFLPRVGESIARDADGYFHYYEVIDVWHREEPEAGRFQPCLAVKIID
ncbi:hypothetical protein QUC32_14035 [Novosphingobium resinovorum]|jgi:hypothetical protein|uniref:Uncharacterized protein n=2 Tax=Novosphingobium resinovorum TaxID=158500 RepID=A0A031K5Y7_9SPHN|nr:MULTISPECIES: hypothetical protein [Novosphingobium]EZP84418.1 hypothetical protein BV97_00169 [Novosphingobium resinovorum]WJM28791.1 hypothetical protein QUC32_14035 [Novosphingobium resinovorum]